MGNLYDPLALSTLDLGNVNQLLGVLQDRITELASRIDRAPGAKNTFTGDLQVSGGQLRGLREPAIDSDVVTLGWLRDNGLVSEDGQVLNARLPLVATGGIRVPTSAAANTDIVTRSQLEQRIAGAAGTVTSVAMTVPAELAVAGSPIVGAGTLALTWNTELANKVFAGPTSGGAATPGFRTLVAADIPALAYVTSVGLSLPAIFSVSGSPVTSSGTLTASLATQSANVVWAGPTSGGASAPTFRALVAADIPSATAIAGDVTGTLAATTVAKINNVAYNADPLVQYALLAGRSGGQVLKGGTATADTLDLYPNSAAVADTQGAIRAFGFLAVQPQNLTITQADTLLTLGGSTYTHNAAGSALSAVLFNGTLKYTAQPTSGFPPKLFTSQPTIDVEGAYTLGNVPFCYNGPTYQPNGGAGVIFTLQDQWASYYDAPIFAQGGSGGVLDAAATYTAFRSVVTVNSSLTLVTRRGFRVDEAAGAGSITTQIGFDIAALAKGTNNYGIQSAIVSAATNRVIRDTGGAASEFKGLLLRAYAPTSQTIPTNFYAQFTKRQQWTSSQRLTLQGTARLRGN